MLLFENPLQTSAFRREKIMKKEPFENHHHRTIYLPEFFQTHPEISLALIYLKTFVKRVAVMTAIDTEALARKLSIYFQ